MIGWSSARELVMVALFAKCCTIAGENRARSSTFCKHAEEMALTGKKWLGDLDSNQDSQIQNLESYRWTISQLVETKRLTASDDALDASFSLSFHRWTPDHRRHFAHG